MAGAPLSRWTMAFFAISLACLMSAEGLLALGFGFPVDDVRAPETLIVVHLVSVGWLSLLMFGALFQFTPVLVDRPLSRPGLVLPALTLLVSGLVLLLSGFLQLAGRLESNAPLLPIGGCLLVAGFAATAWILGETLWRARPLSLPAHFVAVGLACLLFLGVLGSLFTHLLSGIVEIDALAARLDELVILHAAIGIGGWLSFSAIGVSYRLLPMFMLAPEGERATSRAVWVSGCFALAAIALGAPLELAFTNRAAFSLSVAGLNLCAMLALYALDLSYFYRKRRRRNVELNIKAAGGAFAALYASALLGGGALITDTLEQHAGALAYLLLFGWLGGLGLSQLYKIVPFLTWLECYGPVMGRKPTPRVQDLVCEGRDGPWFALYFAGVFCATAALLFDQPALFRLCAVATLLATTAIVIELVLARRLFNVSGAARLPEGAQLPRIFVAGADKQ